MTTTPTANTAAGPHREPRESVGRGLGWLLVASVVAGIILHGLWLLQPWRLDRAAFPMFLGDEGAHGLMALHILGGARPIFYYGAFYHGAFDAYLSAAAFWLFGDSLAGLRLIPTSFALASIPLAYGIGQRLYGRRAALLAAALVAVPSRFVFEWGTLSLCGYCGFTAFVLLMCFLALLLFERVTPLRVGLLGFAAGVSIWSNQLTITYAAVIGAALWVWAPFRRRHVAVLAVTVAVGMAPLIYGNIAYPLSTVRQLGRKALFAWTLSKEPRDGTDAAPPRTYESLPVLQVLGAQQRRDGRYSLLGAVGAFVLALGFFGGLKRCWTARGRDPADYRRHLVILGLVAVALAVGVGGFLGQPIGRYQLPLYPLLAVLAAGWLVRRGPRLAGVVVAVVVAAQAALIAVPSVAGERTETGTVLQALERLDLRHGYAAGPMYEIIFRSREHVILVPLDHPRYTPYTRAVAAADRVFYIYRTDQEAKHAHRALVSHLRDENVAYEHFVVGDYRILYGFAPKEAMSPAAIAAVRNAFRKEKFGR